MNICHLIVVLKDPSDCSKRPVYRLFTRDPTSDHQYTETRSVNSTGGGAFDLSAAATPVSGRAVTKKEREVQRQRHASPDLEVHSSGSRYASFVSLLVHLHCNVTVHCFTKLFRRVVRSRCSPDQLCSHLRPRGFTKGPNIH